MKESEILKRIHRAASAVGMVLWRNHIGRAFQGSHTRLKAGQLYTARPGDVVVHAARVVQCGLCVGSSDYVGYVLHKINPESVGRVVPVFVGVEGKTASGSLTEDQKNWLNHLHSVGACGIVARSAEDFTEQARKFLQS